MKFNVGTIDRVGRIVLAVVASVLFFGGIVTGPAGMAIAIAGAILGATGAAGTCPLYSIAGIQTCAKTESDASAA